LRDKLNKEARKEAEKLKFHNTYTQNIEEYCEDEIISETKKPEENFVSEYRMIIDFPLYLFK
jgi:hypothetical protein